MPTAGTPDAAENLTVPERTARVYRADGSESLIGQTEVLRGEDVLPGFECELHVVFAGLA